MQLFRDIALDQYGQPIQEMGVTVLLGRNPAQIFNAAGASQANPILTNADGEFSFRAANGTYSISLLHSAFNSGAAKEIEVQLFDPADAPQALGPDGKVSAAKVGDLSGTYSLVSHEHASYAIAADTSVAIALKADSGHTHDYSAVYAGKSTTESALEGKADITYVDAAIAASPAVDSYTKAQVNAQFSAVTHAHDYTSNFAGKDATEAAIAAKADISYVDTAMAETYTKSQADALLAAKTDTAYVDTAVAEAIVDSYTKTDSDARYALAGSFDTKADVSYVDTGLAGVYTKAESDLALAAKADASNVNSALGGVYTKSQADVLLATKADSSAVDTALAGVYTKAEADALLAAKADSSALATKADSSAVDTALAGVYTKAETDALVAGVYTKAEADALVAGLASTDYVDTAVAGTYTKAQVDYALSQKAEASALAAKADITSVYTKTESDNALTSTALAAAVRGVQFEDANTPGTFYTIGVASGAIVLIPVV